MGLAILLLIGGAGAVLVGLLFLWRSAGALLSQKRPRDHVNALLEFEDDDMADADSAELIAGYGGFARRDLVLTALLWLLTVAVGLACMHLAGASLGWWALYRP